MYYAGWTNVEDILAAYMLTLLLYLCKSKIRINIYGANIIWMLCNTK